MKASSQIVSVLFIVTVGCLGCDHGLNDPQVEAAKGCLELDGSRNELSARVSELVSIDPLTKNHLIDLANVFHRDIEEKNSCLKRYTRQILKNDELSAEFSQYLSDISAARSLLMVSVEQWDEIGASRINETLRLTLEYVD